MRPKLGAMQKPIERVGIITGRKRRLVLNPRNLRSTRISFQGQDHAAAGLHYRRTASRGSGHAGLRNFQPALPGRIHSAATTCAGRKPREASAIPLCSRPTPTFARTAQRPSCRRLAGLHMVAFVDGPHPGRITMPPGHPARRLIWKVFQVSRSIHDYNSNHRLRASASAWSASSEPHPTAPRSNLLLVGSDKANSSAPSRK